MRVLIVEDEPINCTVIREILSPYGKCDLAVDGVDAVRAYRRALTDNSPYDLICMDIMLPGIDGQHALRQIRHLENQMNIEGPDRAKAIMLTALSDAKNVIDAYYRGGASSYVVKPVDKKKLLDEVKKLGFIE